jgi:hypothetical protein
MSVDLKQTESLSSLIEAISRWEAVAENLRSEGLKIMVAEHMEFLRQQLNRQIAEASGPERWLGTRL